MVLAQHVGNNQLSGKLQNSTAADQDSQIVWGGININGHYVINIIDPDVWLILWVLVEDSSKLSYKI